MSKACLSYKSCSHECERLYTPVKFKGPKGAKVCRDCCHYVSMAGDTVKHKRSPKALPTATENPLASALSDAVPSPLAV